MMVDQSPQSISNPLAVFGGDALASLHGFHNRNAQRLTTSSSLANAADICL
jgi:hypothetical protein